MNWEQMALIVGALSPLVGVPLVAISLYLRALRDYQASGMSEMAHRISAMEGSIRDLLGSTADFEREYATKEEWVREAMLARQKMERLTEMVTRIQAEVESGQTIAAELSRATSSMIHLVSRLTGGHVVDNTIQEEISE